MNGAMQGYGIKVSMNQVHVVFFHSMKVIDLKENRALQKSEGRSK
jgi:hypothetical protein